MIDQSLINYIKDGIQKGYSREELKKILLENEWSEREISDAFNILGKGIIKMQPIQKGFSGTIQQKPNQDIIQTSLTFLEKDRLLKFINTALSKNIDPEEIKLALLRKGWPTQKIDEAFALVQGRKQTYIGNPEESKQIILKPEKKITPNVILSYVISFILITVVVGATIMLMFYVIALTNYEVVDPATGQTVKGACLEEKCTDMKDYAFKEVGLHKDSTDRGKIWLSLGIATGIAIVMVLAYAFAPFKVALLWIINLLYFLFIGYIAYLWIRFNYIVLN